LASSSSHAEEKKTKKKNHREENKCREGRELSFKLPLCLFTFAFPLLPFCFKRFLMASLQFPNVGNTQYCHLGVIARDEKLTGSFSFESSFGSHNFFFLLDIS
jgi:hypothetical protein